MSKKLNNEITWLWVIMLIIIVIAVFASCSTAEKLIDKAEAKDPAAVAKYTRLKYPCTDLLKPDTAVIWKDSVIYIDCPDNNNPFEVVTVRTDTINNVVTNTIRVPVKVQIPGKIITKWYEDSAKLRIAAVALNNAEISIQSLQASNDSLKAKSDHRGKENWIWRVIATVLICWQVWKIYRKIMIKI